jgi:hypothetical protein
MDDAERRAIRDMLRSRYDWKDIAARTATVYRRLMQAPPQRETP